jgi:CHAT domain-containing protein
MTFMFNAGLHLFGIPGSMGRMIPILRSRYVKMLYKRSKTVTDMLPAWCLLLSAVLVSGIAIPRSSYAQTDKPPMTEEYFVQQDAGEALLIRINAFEAEFESKISEQDGVLLLQSGIQESRIAPVFQYIHAPKKDRQLEIEVTSNLNTRRSEFGLALTRLEVWDERSGSVSRAYQLLSSIAYTMSREILAELKGSRLQKIELATLQLQSAAMIGLKRSGVLRTSASDPNPVQTVLSRTAALAESMGFKFEQASALNTSGTEYASEAFYAKALEQFQQAVAIADSVGDTDLATGIRESIVQVHAVQGNTSASGEVLREIETQLVEGGTGDELALNLLAQGRLLIRSYRYRQAFDVLSEALGHQNNSAIRKQINFELAKVFYESGRPDESKVYLQKAGVSLGPGQQTRANSVIDVGEGLWILANINRTGGDYEQMRKARSAQGLYRPPHARYLYDQGLDELAPARKNRQRAQSLFRQSYTAASKTGHKDLQHLSRLQFCALGSTGDDVLCSKTSTRGSYEWLIAGGVPRHSVAAMFLWAKILVSNGRRSEAISVLHHLVDDIHLFRHSLPGVLGAWYRERHEEMSEYYLDLLGRADAPASLLALSKIRFIETYTGFDSISPDESGDTDLLRVQLAQRASSADGQVQSDLKDNINRGLVEIQVPFKKEFEFLSKNGLQQYLRSLANDEIVLTYHISPTTAQVWVGRNGKVQQRNIANPAYLYGALQEARQGLADIGISSFDNKMNALGKRLITPIADLLSDKIYWIPSGPLLGFPLDALRVKGRYLLERHTIVNLVSFPGNPNPVASLQAESLANVFLAGHPQDYTSDYATRLDSSTEIRAIADIFVGPGLSIIQGAALLPDEFQDARFRQADLVHLSMPGFIDLEYPEQSSLELSGNEYNPARAVLWPEDISSQQLDASLVFLSATRINNPPPSGFSSRQGLISDFADAGAHSVIANLWADNGKAVEAFITDFYARLKASGDVADSLKGAKNQYIKNNRSDGLYDWAGYQLFID